MPRDLWTEVRQYLLVLDSCGFKVSCFYLISARIPLNLREVLSWCNTPWLSKTLGKLILLFYGPVWQGVEALPPTIPVMITRIANFVSRIFLKRKENYSIDF